MCVNGHEVFSAPECIKRIVQPRRAFRCAILREALVPKLFRRLLAVLFRITAESQKFYKRFIQPGRSDLIAPHKGVKPLVGYLMRDHKFTHFRTVIRAQVAG